MRFKVGEKYAFINVEFDRGGDFTFGPYRPWADTLKGISLLELECTEHHRVPVLYDADRKVDGFLFIDPATGDEWANQYPTASYGQCDDTEDGIARRYVKSGHLDLTDGEVFGYTEASRYIGVIIRATDPESMGYLGDDEKIAALVEFQSQLMQMLQEKEFRVEIGPVGLFSGKRVIVEKGLIDTPA